MKLIVIIYLVCIIPAIIFTYCQEMEGMTMREAPNRLLGVLAHFMSVWAITPFFIMFYAYNQIFNKNNND